MRCSRASAARSLRPCCRATTAFARKKRAKRWWLPSVARPRLASTDSASRRRSAWDLRSPQAALPRSSICWPPPTRRCIARSRWAATGSCWRTLTRPLPPRNPCAPRGSPIDRESGVTNGIHACIGVADPIEHELAAQLEAELFIEAERCRVVAQHVQKRGLAALRDFPAQVVDQPAREAFAAPVVIHADGADFDVSVEAHPFARHRNQPPMVANADVAAHLVRARPERPRFGFLREFEHLFRVGVGQTGYILIVHGFGVA